MNAVTKWTTVHSETFASSPVTIIVSRMAARCSFSRLEGRLKASGNGAEITKRVNVFNHEFVREFRRVRRNVNGRVWDVVRGRDNVQSVITRFLINDDGFGGVVRVMLFTTNRPNDWFRSGMKRRNHHYLVLIQA